MQVDTQRSAQLGRRIDREQSRGHEDKVQRLRRERARVDERFDGAKALAATGRYLKLARDTLGREDFAIVSYHMGIGNLQGVLRAFGESSGWPEVYFDSTFTRHAEAYGRLIKLGDDSSNYYWKVLAGREIMRLYRDDRTELERLIALHGAKGSAEEVLHPPGSVPQFADPGQLRAAWDDEADRRVPRHAGGHGPGARRQAWASWRAGSTSPPGSTAGCGPRRSRWRSTSARRSARSAAPRRSWSPRRCATSATRRSSSRATARRPATSRCTRRAGRSTSSAATSRAARRWRSRTCSTGCPCSAGSRGCGSRSAIHVTVSSEAEALLPLLERIQPSP